MRIEEVLGSGCISGRSVPLCWGSAVKFFDVDIVEEEGGKRDEVDRLFCAIGILHRLRQCLFSVDPESPLCADALDHELMPRVGFQRVVIFAVDAGDLECPERLEDIGRAVAFPDVFWVVFIVGEVPFTDSDTGVGFALW